MSVLHIEGVLHIEKFRQMGVLRL